MNPLEQVSKELRELGFKPRIEALGGFGSGLVVIDYDIGTGRYKGQTFKVGIAFQEDAYPEYPPHFVGVANLSSPRLPVHSAYCCGNDTWSLFSVPPSDFWDSLRSAEKNMKTYVRRHLARLWDQL